MHPLQDLRLDTPEGHGLVRPRFFVECFIEYPSAATTLGFYEAALAAIGPELRFVDTGSGTWRKRTAKTDAYLPTWCAAPVLWPKKIYTLILQDVDIGLGDFELHIDYAARERLPPNPDWLRRLQQGGFAAPVCLSRFRVSFAPDHPLVARPSDILDWVRALPALQDETLVSATAGYAIDVPINPPQSTQGPEARARAGALLQAHPGLTCVNRMPIGNSLLQWDADYATARGQAVPRPYVKRAHWLTILNRAQVELLGGVDLLRARLQASSGVSLQACGAAFVIQAGPQPEIGDAGDLGTLAACRAVAQAIKPVTLARRFFNPSLGSTFDEFGFDSWFDALDRA